MSKPRDYIEKLFEPPASTERPKTVGMIVQARASSSEEIDADEAAEHEAEKYQWPIAFWNGENDELEPLTKGDLKKLESLGVTPWEYEVLMTENYLEMKERQNR
jgi:hypothetical protein